MSWAAHEMAGARFGDRRLNQRAASLLDTFGAKPTLSIPGAARGWAETQAAYRFFDHARVSAETVLEPHVAATLERARAHPVVLAIQDTTELDFTGKDDIEGLGPLTYEAQRGLHLHPTFLVTPERVPLGVFDAWLWARDPEHFGQSSKGLPIEDKESVRWLEGYQRLGEVAPELPDTRLVYLADREADIYELFVEANNTAVELLVRANHDRALTDGAKLRQQVLDSPSLGAVTFELPKTAKRRARTVTQSLHAKRVRIRAPKGKATLAASVEPTAVLAHETDPPEGEIAVQWLLLTTLPVDTFEQAVEKMQWYLCRWEIGVSSQGHIIQSVEVRPGLRDSGPVAWEAPWRESKAVEPSDNILTKEDAQHTRPQRTVNVEVASSHAFRWPRRSITCEGSKGGPKRVRYGQPSPAGYQRWHGVKDSVATGEALVVRRRNLVEEVCPITVSGKWTGRRQGDGSGRSTGDRRAAKRASREGPGPVGISLLEVRQG